MQTGQLEIRAGDEQKYRATKSALTKLRTQGTQPDLDRHFGQTSTADLVDKLMGTDTGTLGTEEQKLIDMAARWLTFPVDHIYQPHAKEDLTCLKLGTWLNAKSVCFTTKSAWLVDKSLRAAQELHLPYHLACAALEKTERILPEKVDLTFINLDW